jgi:hypothetical protein
MPVCRMTRSLDLQCFTNRPPALLSRPASWPITFLKDAGRATPASSQILAFSITFRLRRDKLDGRIFDGS